MIASASNSQLVGRVTAIAFQTPEGREADRALNLRFDEFLACGVVSEGDRREWMETARRNLLINERRWNGPIYTAYREAMDNFDQRTL